MAGDDAQYEFRSVHSIRGTEARTMQKLQKEGWEFVSQSQELLRTKMTFRRLKPQQSWRSWGIGTGALLLIGIIGMGVSSIQNEDDTSAPTAQVSEAATTPTTQPSVTVTEEVATKTTEPAEPSPADAAQEQVLTADNNPEFAALLAGSDTDYDLIEAFAAKYKDRTIEFDANIGAMNNHASYKTRYDILILSGNHNEPPMTGPNFQFRDVNLVNDLHLKGSNIPDTLGAGANLRVIARVESFNSTQGLFFLKPISTGVS